jgi:hypothetical protein
MDINFSWETANLKYFDKELRALKRLLQCPEAKLRLDELNVSTINMRIF